MAGSAVSHMKLPRVKVQSSATVPTVIDLRDRARSYRDYADAPTAAHELATTLSRKKWSILAFALAGGLLGAIVGLARPTIYESTAQLIIAAPPASTAPGAPPVQDAVDASIDDHITMLMSQDHLRRVASALIKVDNASGETAEESAIVPATSSAESPSAESPEGQSGLSGAFDRLWPHSEQAAADAELKLLSEETRIGQELRSRIISVAFADPDPNRAALVANTYLQVYIEHLTQRRQMEDQAQLDAIATNLPRVHNELIEVTDRLENYRLSHGAVDQGQADSAARESADLNQQISMSRANLAAMEAHVKAIKDLRDKGGPLAEIVTVVGSPELADLVARSESSPNDQGLKDAIKAEIDRAIAAESAQADIFRAQVGTLESRRDVLNKVLEDTASRLSGLRALEPPVTLLNQRYIDMLSRQQELTRRVASPTAGVSLYSPAWPPSKPATLPPILLIPPGMIIFATLGAVLALVGNRMDKSLRGEAEAESALGAPCLSSIPESGTVELEKLRDLVQGQPGSAYSRAVISLLVTAAPNQSRTRTPFSLMVTSSAADDSANELAWSLALAATRFGGPVLFIDLEGSARKLTADYLKQCGGTRRSFGDFVRSNCRLNATVARRPEVGVDLMTSSDSDDLLAVLMGAESRECKDELLAEYNVVIISAPPAASGPEARFLTNWSDAALLAVRWGKTPRGVVSEALEQLRRDGAASVRTGVVLTGVNLKKNAMYGFGEGTELTVTRAT